MPESILFPLKNISFDEYLLEVFNFNMRLTEK